LANQPTLSRLENTADRCVCYRLAQSLLSVYLHERERDGDPTQLLLDLDSTADSMHGEQEGSGYHGYYQQHMYHPLLIVEGLYQSARHCRLAPRHGACQPRCRSQPGEPLSDLLADRFKRTEYSTLEAKG
jgi:hypothetical protein